MQVRHAFECGSEGGADPARGQGCQCSTANQATRLRTAAKFRSLDLAERWGWMRISTGIAATPPTPRQIEVKESTEIFDCGDDMDHEMDISARTMDHTVTMALSGRFDFHV